MRSFDENFMASFTTTYLGELRCSNIHEKSGTEIFTDAPVDNQGRGSAFSPTDLCALSLTTCIITTMGIYAQIKGFDIPLITASTQKVMDSNPRRIIKIISNIQISLSGEATERQREGLLRIAHTCPVAKSLHPDIEQAVTILFNC
jgi:uncharacterized OsmC-like protein